MAEHFFLPASKAGGIRNAVFPMKLPILDTRVLYSAPVESVAHIGFRAHGNDYLGVQFTVNGVSEVLWDHDNMGGWNGPMWGALFPGELSVAGVPHTRDISTQDSAIARVGSGESIVLTWQMPPAGGLGVQPPPATQRVVVVDCSDDSVVFNDTLTGALSSGPLPKQFEKKIGVLPDGSYIAWVHCESYIVEGALPPDYVEVTGNRVMPDKFRFVSGGKEYVWDWEYDVGTRPTDRLQLAEDGETVLYDEFERLRASGGLKTISEWTAYITTQGAQDSEWSALQIQVGGGTWQAGVAAPFPGAALVKGDGAGGSVPVNFDPRARNIKCVWHEGERTFIAGCIATRSGPSLGYWELHDDDTSTLRAVKLTEVITDHVCAFAQMRHYPTDIWHDRDGTEWVLTIGYLYKLRPNHPDIAERFVGIPLDTTGHPGGRVLRRSGGLLSFFKDGFNSNNTQHFYNTMVIQAERRINTIGTVFHDDCSADIYGGKLYSFRQNQHLYNEDGELQEDAYQRLDRIDNGQWHDTETLRYRASDYNWQRVRSIHTSEGARLLCAGRTRLSPAVPLWGYLDGQEFTQAYCPWFTRRMEPATQDDGSQEAYCVAFPINDDKSEMHLLAVSAVPRQLCAMWDGIGYHIGVVELDNAEVDAANLPDYLYFYNTGVNADSAGGFLVPSNTQPDAPHLLKHVLGNGDVSYQPTGALGYDPDVWCQFCFTVATERSVMNETMRLQPCAQFPVIDTEAGENYIAIRREISSEQPWEWFQVSDVSEFLSDGIGRILNTYNEPRPNLWYRVDSDDDADDLTTYRHWASWDRKQPLHKPATQHIDVCVIVPPGATVRAPVVHNAQ